MNRPTILFILGTRAEAIKALPVIRALRERHSGIRVRVGATGQHSMLFDQIVDIEGLKISWNIEAMRTRQPLHSLLGTIVSGLENPVRHDAPDRIVAVGDSASAMGAALAAHASRLPLAHLEAGLRGEKAGLPFPEEGFRKMISAAAAAHFAPTEAAKANLLAEGIKESAIFVEGDSGWDSLAERMAGDPDIDDPELREIDWRRPLAVATVVRRENHADGMIQLCETFKRISEEHADLQIILANHLNPHIMEPARLLLADCERIRVTLPLPHQPFVNLLRRASAVFTDSGTVHEEASALGIPIVSLRACQDRGRAMGEGTVYPADNDLEAVLAAANRALAAARPAAELRRSMPAFRSAAAAIADRLAALAGAADFQTPA